MSVEAGRQLIAEIIMILKTLIVNHWLIQGEKNPVGWDCRTGRQIDGKGHGKLCFGFSGAQ
jgi:hypothetical protein